MLANDRVITIAASSPLGETRVTSAWSARGLSSRQVTAIVGCLAARIRSATVTASDVAPDREMITTGSRRAAIASSEGATSTASGRRMSSESGVAITGRRIASRAAAATVWAR